MVFSLLGAAIAWNFGTWRLGLPASSSHALIGSILGVGLANSVMEGKAFGAGINWDKALEVGLSLLLSPLLGFGLAAILLLFAKRTVRQQELYQAPVDGQPPPGWIRAILIFTCTGVSVAHGSNDGQKGVGIVMLILIGLLPARYMLNLSDGREQVAATREAAGQLATFAQQASPAAKDAERESHEVESLLEGVRSYDALDVEDRWRLRAAILELDAAVRRGLERQGDRLSDEEREQVRDFAAAAYGAHRVCSDLGAADGRLVARRGHHHRLEANRGDGRREDRQDASQLRPGRLLRVGGHEHYRPGRQSRLSCQHDARAFIGRRGDDGRQSRRRAGGLDQENPLGLGLDLARYHAAGRRRLLFVPNLGRLKPDRFARGALTPGETEWRLT